MSSFFESRYRYLPFMFLALIGYWFTRYNPYFWDTIQFGSEHAHWYFDNNFKYFLLPEKYDSGHPPLFGMYVAVWWKLFGKALPISHLSMLPFTLLSIYLLFKVGDKFLPKRFVHYFVLICIVDPVTASQHCLVSPDIVIYCGTLLCFYGVVYEKSVVLFFGALLLSCISMRGLSVAAAFGIYQVINYWLHNRPFNGFQLKSYLQLFLPYAPGLLLFTAFMVYHYTQCGWVGYHENSPWAHAFVKVGPAGFLRNIGVAGFRTLEFGRFGLVLVLLLFIWKNRKQLNVYFSLLLLVGLFVFCLILPQLFYTELLGPRYFMPVFMLLSLLFVVFLFKEPVTRKTYLIFGSVVLIFLSGNLIQYPLKMAMGWDATLKHLCYFKPREEMLSYIEENNIPYESIGSSSLEGGPRENIELNGNPHSFMPMDLSKQTLIYYTNVMNLSDEEIDQLFTEFEIVKRFENCGIEVCLFKRIEYSGE